MRFMSSFSVEDFYLGGIGLDLAGAYLVSRGLLQSTRQLALSGGTVWSLEKPLAPYAAADRVKACVGLASIFLGFIAQATGYALYLLGWKVRTGTADAVIGVGFAVGTAAMVVLLDARSSTRRRRKLLVKIARFNPETGKLRAFPLAHLLTGYGEETEGPKLPGEGDRAYCRRVFKTEVEVGQGYEDRA